MGAIVLNQPKGHKEAARDMFTSSVSLLANTLAAIAAFLCTGPIYKFSIGPARDLAASQYGAWMGDLTTFVWGLVVAVAVFAFARASLATAITLGGFAIAARLFV